MRKKKKPVTRIKGFIEVVESYVCACVCVRVCVFFHKSPLPIPKEDKPYHKLYKGLLNPFPLFVNPLFPL